MDPLPAPPSVPDLIEAYLADRAGRVAPATIAFYRKRLKFLAQFRHVSELTKPSVLAALAAANAGKAPDTIRGNIIAWQQLQAWAVEAGHLPAPLTGKIAKPSGRQRDHLPSKEDVQAILKHSPADFHVIFKALRCCGARPSELCRADIEHIDRGAEEIVLAEHKTAKKTQRPRRIPIGHETLRALVAAAIGARTAGPIFTDARGRRWTAKRLSEIYRRARDRAGLSKQLVLYLTRHAFGAQIYEATGDLKATGEALGHSGISNTLRYTRRNAKRVRHTQTLFDDSLPDDEQRAA